MSAILNSLLTVVLIIGLIVLFFVWLSKNICKFAPTVCDIGGDVFGFFKGTISCGFNLKCQGENVTNTVVNQATNIYNGGKTVYNDIKKLF